MYNTVGDTDEEQLTCSGSFMEDFVTVIFEPCLEVCIGICPKEMYTPSFIVKKQWGSQVTGNGVLRPGRTEATLPFLRALQLLGCFGSENLPLYLFL